MIRYLLDTDHLSLLQRRHPKVLENLQRVGRAQVGISIVTAEEQLRGWLSLIRKRTGDTPQKLAWAYSGLNAAMNQLKTFERLAFDEAAGEHFWQLREQKVRIGTQDLRIACVALTRDLVLVTRNRRDFEQMPGLKIEDWTVKE